MSPHDLEAWLQAARKELAAALRIMRHTRWPRAAPAMLWKADIRASCNFETSLNRKERAHGCTWRPLAQRSGTAAAHGGLACAGQGRDPQDNSHVATFPADAVAARDEGLLALVSRHIKDGQDISPALAREFRVMLRRAGVKRRVWELHRDATTIVLKVLAANKGVWHADPGDDVLYLPVGGEIWEHPEREFG
jgi:hypothetical protein